MRKGFTLIELLAVIVILAIIALIATPIVLSIIEETKESAVLRSAEYYLSSVENSIMKKNLTSGGSFSPNVCEVQEDGNLLCDGTETLEIEVNGEVPSTGTITLEKGKIKKVEVELSNKEVQKNLFTGELEYKLAPGLYDKNDKLILSWGELNIKYDINNRIAEGTDYDGDSAGKVIDSIKGAYKLVFDNSVTYVGFSAFGGSKLTSIILPETEFLVNDRAFADCENLKNIIIPANTVYTEYVEDIFYNCTSLTDVIFEEGIKKVAFTMFSRCINLKNVKLPNSITVIEAAAFERCTSLKTIKLPNNLDWIDDDAFFDSGLESITIPSSVRGIGPLAFSGTKLKSIVIPKTVEDLFDSVFRDCKDLTTVVIEGNANLESTFSGCTSLTSVTLSDEIVGIYFDTFSGCTSLKNIKLPNNLKFINSGAFANTGLESITIPSSVTQIEENAFVNSNNLRTIYYKGTSEDPFGDNWGATNATVITDF